MARGFALSRLMSKAREFAGRRMDSKYGDAVMAAI